MNDALPLFDAELADEAAERGIDRAVRSKPELLEYIKGLAVRIGRRKRFVTADDVQRVLIDQGVKDAGNVMGGVFKDRAVWRFSKFVKCQRVNSHGRMIREWEFIG